MDCKCVPVCVQILYLIFFLEKEKRTYLLVGVSLLYDALSSLSEEMKFRCFQTVPKLKHPTKLEDGLIQGRLFFSLGRIVVSLCFPEKKRRTLRTKRRP